MSDRGNSATQDDFVVIISASGRANVDNTDGSSSQRVIHAVSVTQPVQSWTVIRDHIDFTNIGNALSPIIRGLPKCPPAPTLAPNATEIDVDEIVLARNATQNWLTNILQYPGARESPVVRHFLCHDANIVPLHLEGVHWVRSFAYHSSDDDPQCSAETKSRAPEADLTHDVDEPDLDFADMYEYPEGHEGSDQEEEDDDYDDIDHFSAVERYQPKEKTITNDDVMEFEEDAIDVEMIEDVGSLAQSMGASHLGRSLQLQADMNRGVPRTENHGAQQGLNIEGPTSSIGGTGNFMGGIGHAMLNAGPQAKSSGLSDSFCQKKPECAARLDSFKMIEVIGKGSFGKVFLVGEKKTNYMYALKVLRKDNIIKRNQVEHTKTERNVLGYVNHPFIVGLKMAFQSKDKLYFVLDYCAGGELFFHLSKVGKFQEPRAAFYAAEIVLALEHIHALDIVYRDLKPENVLLDAKGHVRLTDFGLSKEGISSSSSGATSFCGTPEYLAPEILSRQGHGRAVDWWSLGALLYEMLTGLPPFYCRDREKLFEKIRKGHLDYPRSLSAAAQALLRGLLTKDPRRRLGSETEDAEMIKKHMFFDDTHWEKLVRGDIPPPWDPQINERTDTRQFDVEFTGMPIQSPPQHRAPNEFVGATPKDNPFEGFTFTDKRFYGPT